MPHDSQERSAALQALHHLASKVTYRPGTSSSNTSAVNSLPPSPAFALAVAAAHPGSSTSNSATASPLSSYASPAAPPKWQRGSAVGAASRQELQRASGIAAGVPLGSNSRPAPPHTLSMMRQAPLPATYEEGDPIDKGADEAADKAAAAGGRMAITDPLLPALQLGRQYSLGVDSSVATLGGQLQQHQQHYQQHYQQQSGTSGSTSGGTSASLMSQWHVRAEVLMAQRSPGTSGSVGSGGVGGADSVGGSNSTNSRGRGSGGGSIGGKGSGGGRGRGGGSRGATGGRGTDASSSSQLTTPSSGDTHSVLTLSSGSGSGRGAAAASSGWVVAQQLGSSAASGSRAVVSGSGWTVTQQSSSTGTAPSPESLKLCTSRQLLRNTEPPETPFLPSAGGGAAASAARSAAAAAGQAQLVIMQSRHQALIREHDGPREAASAQLEVLQHQHQMRREHSTSPGPLSPSSAGAEAELAALQSRHHMLRVHDVQREELEMANAERPLSPGAAALAATGEVSFAPRVGWERMVSFSQVTCCAGL